MDKNSKRPRSQVPSNGILTKSYFHNEPNTHFYVVRRSKTAPHKHLGESRFVNGSKTPCGVVFIYKEKIMSGGILGGLILAIIALVIAALRKRYPAVTTIIIRTILGLIFAALIGGVIYLLVNPPK